MIGHHVNEYDQTPLVESVNVYVSVSPMPVRTTVAVFPLFHELKVHPWAAPVYVLVTDDT